MNKKNDAVLNSRQTQSKPMSREMQAYLAPRPVHKNEFRRIRDIETTLSPYWAWRTNSR